MALRFGRQDGGFASGLLFAAQTALVAGVVGTGAINADVATVAGSGARVITGTGALQAQDASASGAGVREIVDLGTPPELESQDSTVSGTGSVSGEVTGSGTPAAQASSVAGTAEREIPGSGT